MIWSKIMKFDPNWKRNLTIMNFFLPIMMSLPLTSNFYNQNRSACEVNLQILWMEKDRRNEWKHDY